MGKVHDAIIDVLSANIAARTDWDESPQLFGVLVDGEQVSLEPIETPNVFTVVHPAVFLTALAELFAQEREALREHPLVNSLFGLAFFFEGQSRTPDRTEERIFGACDQEGYFYDLRQLRGGGIESQIVHRATGQVEGLIPIALVSLLDAMTGRGPTRSLHPEISAS